MLWLVASSFGVSDRRFLHETVSFPNFRSFVAYSSDYSFDAAMQLGRFVSVFGFIMGWLAWMLLSALLFVRIPKQDAVLNVISIVCFTMAALSLLLFVGMATDNCDDVDCSPRAVFAAIPAAVLFVAAAGLTIYFRCTSKISS
jgi:sulfite exporter TauE/SafE